MFFWPVTVTVKQSQPCATCMCRVSRMTGAYCTHISRIDLLSARGLHSASIFLSSLLLGTHSTCEFALSYMPVVKKYCRKNIAISREYCYGDIPRQLPGPFFSLFYGIVPYDAAMTNRLRQNRRERLLVLLLFFSHSTALQWTPQEFLRSSL